jgi:hypothetical protein
MSPIPTRMLNAFISRAQEQNLTQDGRGDGKIDDD